MAIQIAAPLTLLASASLSSIAMKSYVTPIVTTLCVLASLASVFFLVYGGIQYMTSSGQPEKLEHAKIVIRNALIGLVIVLIAITLTAILSHAYVSSGSAPTEKLPDLAQIQPSNTADGLAGALISAIVTLLQNIIQSIGTPFVTAISYFTNSTPLMGNNASVFNLWLAVVGITDVLFVLAIILIGFHVMSFSAFGFEEIELKQLLPQLALIFLLVNTSIFIIDGIIGLSNAMIYALQSGFQSSSIWDMLAKITQQSSEMGVAGLLVMISFLVVTVLLLVYYIGRLIALYVGAILAPLVLLLWLLPAFKDFAITAAKTYLALVFVLFVHAVIILLAASLFSGMLQGNTNGQPNTLMALLLGLATVLALLKTQGVMQEFAYATSGPRAARMVAGSFIRGVSYLSSVGSPRRRRRKGSGQDDENQDQEGQSPQTKQPTAKKQRAYGRPLNTGETRRAPQLSRTATPQEQTVIIEKPATNPRVDENPRTKKGKRT